MVIDVTPVRNAVAAPEPPSPTRNPADEADKSARTTFRPNRTGRVKLADVRNAYHEWCRRRALDPLPDVEIGRALNELFSSVGLHRRGAGAKAAIVGIDWSHSEPLRIEGR